jgi:hypothetical protein
VATSGAKHAKVQISLGFLLPDAAGSPDRQVYETKEFFVAGHLERENGLVAVSLSMEMAAISDDVTRKPRGEEMQTEKFARYVVTVPVGVRISDAVAHHREETGHGGTCILRFARSEDHSFLTAPSRSGSEAVCSRTK